MASRREVRRSTHGAASVCLPTPLYASRRLCGQSVGIGQLHPDSRSYGPESACYGLSSVAHEALLRNEGAVGSNPIASCVRPAWAAVSGWKSPSWEVMPG